MTTQHEIFADKVAIVTGAAQGIGEAVALQLAAGGAKVLVVDYNMTGAEAVAAKINETGGNAKASRVDVTQPEEIESCVQQAADTWGRIDILVNNASNVATVGAADADVVSITLETWDLVYACNLRGPAAACKYAIPHMIAGGGGAIVNLASIQGLSGDLDRTAYGSMKAGLISMSRYVSTQFAAQGVRCNSVAPGLVMSPSAQEVPEKVMAVFDSHIPVPFRGQPTDLAEVICFLASDAARYITGQNLTADGGMTSHLPFYSDFLRGR